jgi:ABC-2 type transport system permease protein
MIILLTVVFSHIIGIRFREVTGDSSLNFGLFLFCGLNPYLVFNQTVSQSINSIRSSATLVGKVVFPLEILPLTRALTVQVDKLFGIAVLVVVVAVLEHRLQWTLLFLPLIIVLQLVFVMGLSYLGAVVGTYFPDIRGALNAIMRGLFFVTPVIWPAERVPENLRWLVDYNPLAFLVQAYRDLILEGTFPDPSLLLYFAIVSGALLVGGFCLFVRYKQNFADLL